MALRIEEQFVVRAPADRVWRFLVDPRRVVGCVPGGELIRLVDDRTFDGRVRIAVGPVVLAYRGRVWLAEVDEAARRVRILGAAHERAGPGSARLTLDSDLATRPDGATEVVAAARVEVAGPLVELGRGVLEALGHLVFRDFAAAVRDAVEAEAAGRAAPPRAPLRVVPLVARAVGTWMRGWIRRRAVSRRRPRSTGGSGGA